jgi:hypothetical protein
MKKLWLPLIAAGLLVTNVAIAQPTSTNSDVRYIDGNCDQLNAAIVGTSEEKDRWF